MRVSLQWLSDYVDLSGYDAEAVARVLTDLGLEVEAVEQLFAIPDSVVVGRILTATPHPDADKLQVCSVDVGSGSPLTIVCGAANARPDLLVAVATEGSRLPNGMHIKAGKIRGQASAGMLCSEEELGLAERSAGILELAEGKPGMRLSEVIGGADQVLVLSVTPNRADCFGYLGVARDFAARTGRQLRIPDATAARFDKDLDTARHVRVDIADPRTCSRFTALFFDQVQGGLPSPLWMRRRLVAAGMRPISLIVDLSNYVMLETGHPNHAYDAAQIKNQHIIVRSAHIQDSLQTLDGATPELKLGDTLICAEDHAIGLGGVMGGQNSEVRDDTRQLILEVASFNPSQIRRTASRLGLHTEASHRFERGVDPTDHLFVANRFANLLLDALPNARVAAKPLDAGETEPALGKIALRLSRARLVLGRSDLTMADCQAALQGLGFALLDDNKDRAVFEVPGFRRDIHRETDLIEEVARITGYDRIPYTMPRITMATNQEDSYLGFAYSARQAMAAASFTETITYPFASHQDFERLGEKHAMFPGIRLENPISESEPFLQTSLVPGLLRGLGNNRRAGINGVRLFEYGRCYFRSISDAKGDWLGKWLHLAKPSRHLTEKAAQEHLRPVERHRLAAVLDQPFLPKNWQNAETVATFYHIKDLLVAALARLGIRQLTFHTSDDAPPFLNPKTSAWVTCGEITLGFAGELHPEWAAGFDLGIRDIPLVFELDTEKLFYARAAEPLPSGGATYRFPGSYRDFAFILDSVLTHATVLETLRKTPGIQYLRDVRLFDLYQGENLPEGKKSLAYRFYFQSPEKTLSDKEVDQQSSRILAWAKGELGAELR